MRRLIPLLFLISTYLGFSESSTVTNPNTGVKASYKWDTGIITIDITEKMDVAHHSFPEARTLADENIRSNAANFFIDKIMNVYVDSASTVKSSVKKNQSLFADLLNIAQKGKHDFSYVSGNMDVLNTRYTFDIYGENGFAIFFIKHKKPYPAKRFLGFEPSRDFSGLVIYARGDYPVIGKNGKDKLNPALFPKIYDENMNLLIEREMCYPDSLKKWGIAAYTDSLDETPFLQRIGVFPLRVMARAVYGENNTDVVISVDAGRKLLVRKRNIDLLRKGRILIILDLN